MLTLVFFVLVCLPSLSSALDKNRLERIRLLHGHDGIDTATVHISYPHSTSLKRLTKREALQNLLPLQHDNFTVKVTLESSGHVLDLELQRSRLLVQGALVTVMKEGGSEEFHVQDEGCHYQGVFDDNRGMTSVHFCDGVLVGGAHNGQVEYNFHSHQHPLPDDTLDASIHSEDIANDPDHDLDQHYHTIVSWKDASGDVTGDFPPDDTLRPEDLLDKGEEEEEGEEGERRERRRREAESSTSQDVNSEVIEVVVPQREIRSEDNRDSNAPLSPVAEFGVIFDEDFLRDHGYLYPTRRDLIHFLMLKYTGVQALYGDPRVTGFNMTIQMKLIYLWEKNPVPTPSGYRLQWEKWEKKNGKHNNAAWYAGSALKISQRMAAGKNFSTENADYRSVDVGALYTSQAPGRVEGIGAVGGICLNHGKTFVTRGYGQNWITECHEFGHTLGLGHVPPPCRSAASPYNRGFMTSYISMFLPCYREALAPMMGSRKCLYRNDVTTVNIPPLRLQRTFPILAFGYNYHCRIAFREDSEFVDEGKEPCAAVLCAVMDPSSNNYGLAQVSVAISSSLFGRSCGPNGMICLNRKCKIPEGHTTVTAIDTVTGTGTWARWSNFDSTCSSACGVGVRISSRTCSNKERAEACRGPRYRAKLCNTQPCPGDELKGERDMRWDRADYACSLLKVRGGPYSQYLRPTVSDISSQQMTSPISMDSCVVACGLEPTNGSQPHLQGRPFGRVIQTDGTVCGPLNHFDRRVLGVTTRCLRGRCIEFGCNGVSMEKRRCGKVKDLCGVCGGDNSTCSSGQTTIRLRNATTGVLETVMELPAGASHIMFAVVPDNYDGRSNIKLALMDKDDYELIEPGHQGYFRIINNEQNPLNYAATYWTTVENEILTAPGPLDQPIKIKVKYMASSSTPVDAVVVWGYKRPPTIPKPPLCQNNGIANTTNGGCTCVESGTRGKHCEFHCHDLCFNGGEMLQPNCHCNCSNSPHTGGPHCGCNYGYAGLNCSQCSVKHCYHGGVRNTTNCLCECPADCQGKALDCSDCKHNPLLPGYKGQYGGGSLEDFLRTSNKRDTSDKDPDEDHDKDHDKTPDVTSGQSSVHSRAGIVPGILGQWSA